MQRIGALLLLLCLAGCGSLWGATTELFTGPPPIDAQEAEDDDLPEGSALRLLLGRNGGTARLLQQLGERRLWRTRRNVVVATDGARVVATSGLRVVLAATHFDGPDPLADPKALLERGADARRLVDLMGPSRQPETMRFGLPLDCRLTADRDAEDATLLLVTERCRGEGLRFTNLFWADAESGAIALSEQWIGPGVPMLVVER
jgi:hypothetical protein